MIRAFLPDMFMKRKTSQYQYNPADGSTDYDYDIVQGEEVDPKQTRKFEANGENEQEGQPQEEKRWIRGVKVSLQKQK